MQKQPLKSSSALYIPNIIGYIRLLLLFIASFYRGITFICLYICSVTLDYFDGKAARTFNQISLLGGALDMIIDRVGTALICLKLESATPFLSVYVILDIFAHMIYFVGMAYTKVHHKAISNNFILRFYYTPLILKIACSGSELYFICLYLIKEHILHLNMNILLLLHGITIFKGFINIFHLYYGINTLAIQ